jgi:hypothetical protein
MTNIIDITSLQNPKIKFVKFLIGGGKINENHRNKTNYNIYQFYLN